MRLGDEVKTVGDLRRILADCEDTAQIEWEIDTVHYCDLVDVFAMKPTRNMAGFVIDLEPVVGPMLDEQEGVVSTNSGDTGP